MKMVARKHEDSFPSNFLYRPWLIQCHGANKPTQTFIDPTNKSIEEREIAEMQGKLCFGCTDEWLFLWDEQSNECFFLESNSLSKKHLPPLPDRRHYITEFSLSSSLDDPDCAVILAGTELEDNYPKESFVLFCRRYDKKWTKLPLKLEGDCIVGATSVIFQGKLFMYTNSDDVVVFDVPCLLEGQIHMRTLETPFLALYPRTDGVGTHLVESCGHIFLVRICQYGDGPTIYIDIHRLDTSSGDEWLRVDSIGERAFFLSNRCYTSVRAMDVGVQCNCIYYLPFSRDGNERRIYKFCLDDHTMTFSLISEERTEYESTLCWFVPTRPRRMIRNSSILPTIVLNEASEDEIIIEEKSTCNFSNRWDDLPIDLLEFLLPHLSLVDCLRLPTVCKAWNLILNPNQKAKTWPWLMYRAKADGTCKLFDPFYGKKYTTKIGMLSSDDQAVMLFSKDGWVVMLDGDFDIFIFNPLLLDVIELPMLKELDDGFHGITFTSVPTTPDCVVLGVSTNEIANSMEIHQWRFGEEEWTKMVFANEIRFRAANTNPVFSHGELYCLGEKGDLGAFNPDRKTWRVLDNLKPVYSEDEVPFRGTQECYLLELAGELVSVFKHNYCDYDVSIFKMDRLKTEWIKVDEIGDWTLFLDPRSSFAKPSPHQSWSNKIFFSAFDSGTSKTCATYCMKSKRFSIDFCDTTKPFDCVWLEPNLV